METSATEMSLNGHQQKPALDLSLRLWSDEVALQSIVEDMEITPTHLYVRGEPIEKEGRFAAHVSDTHYASIFDLRCDTGDQVNVWLMDVLGRVENQVELSEGLKEGRIRAEAWIVLLSGVEGTRMPLIEDSLIRRSKSDAIRLFLENYTVFDEGGTPKKTWLS